MNHSPLPAPILASVVALLLCLMLGMALAADAQETDKQACPRVKIVPERLPRLNIPRASHQTFCPNGEFVVIGGHTDGFVPTPTAEYFSGGAWHTVNTVYTHDSGLAVQLRSGKVLLAGGSSEALGIGQTFTAELYDPSTHSFEGFGCLDRKRTWASGLELDSGHVVIAGNWYADDGMELFDGKRSFRHVKSMATDRSLPYIFRTAKDNAIIFSSKDTRDNEVDSIWIDRLRGEPFRVELFQDWRPLVTEHRNDDGFIGDEAKGVYEYLLPVVNKQGQVAVAKVSGETFSLLPTDCPIPMTGVQPTDSIQYISTFLADRKARCAYLVGLDRQYRLYIVRLSDKRKLTLFYTDPLKDIGISTPVLTPEGDLLMAGGIHDDNFKPFDSVVVFRLGTRQPTETTSHALAWIAAGVLLLLLLAAFWLYKRQQDRRRPDGDRSLDDMPDGAPADTRQHDELMEAISHLMEERQLFLNSNLKLSNVAAELNTNSRYVSDCIKEQRGCTFSQFVNNYRIAYAQKLMSARPDMKMAEAAMSAGFANETTFFRAFKSIAGVSPKEWISSREA